MGGVFHSIFWFLAMLEFLAVAINIHLQIARLLLAAAMAQASILLRTDALTAALTMPAESQ